MCNENETLVSVLKPPPLGLSVVEMFSENSICSEPAPDTVLPSGAVAPPPGLANEEAGVAEAAVQAQALLLYAEEMHKEVPVPVVFFWWLRWHRHWHW